MAGYNRNDTSNNIADGNVINASDLDGEFDALDAAFDESTGHTHDGTSGAGAPITKVGPTQDVVVSSTAVTPKTDNAVDLGSSSLEFKDLYIDGTANIDSLVADTADINAGTIDGAVIGGSSAAAGTFTSLTSNSTTTLNGTTIPSSKTLVVTTDIGTSVQAYDADTAKLDVSQSWSAAQAFNAGVTLGDASGDALTINSSAVSIPNGLNFDSNTLVIDATNNRVGINVASPSATLQVNSAGTSLCQFTGAQYSQVRHSDGTRVFLTQVYDNLGILGMESNTPLVIMTNNAERMRITSAGNVGIGTSSPPSPLSVRSSGTSTAFAGNIVSRLESNGAGYSSTLQLSNNVDASVTLGLVSGALGFGIGTTERMRLDSSGNLGIGTSSPTFKLEVNQSGAGIVHTDGTRIFSTYLDSSGVWLGSRSNHNLQFYTNNGSPQLTLNTSGNLGLGATPSAWNSATKNIQTPSGTVYSINTTDFGAVQNAFLDSTGTWKYVSTAAASYLAQAGGAFTWASVGSGTAGATAGFTEKMKLDVSGNLGLGVTPSAWDAGYKTFQLASSSPTALVGSGNQTDLVTNAYFGTSSWRYFTSSVTASRYRQADGTHAFYTAPSGTAGNAITFTQAMTLDASGNLGIGTTSALKAVTSAGSTATNYQFTARDTRSMAANVGGGIAFEGNDGTLSDRAFGAIIGAKENATSGNYASYLSFLTRANGSAPEERMRINSSGNLGIGTTSPSQKLHVEGGNILCRSASIPTSLTLQSNQSTGYNVALTCNWDDNILLLSAASKKVMEVTGYTSADTLKLFTGGTERMRIDGSGNLCVGTTSAGARIEVVGAGNTILTRFSGNTTSNAISDLLVNRSGTASTNIGQGSNIQLRNSTSNKGYLIQAADDVLQFWVNPGTDVWTERMRIDSSGNTLFAKAVRATITTDNDLSFDMNAASNFKSTPTSGGALTFTNITSGQTGNIILVNGSNYAITAAATTKVSATCLATISATGTYWLSYYSDGTNVYVANTGALA